MSNLSADMRDLAGRADTGQRERAHLLAGAKALEKAEAELARVTEKLKAAREAWRDYQAAEESGLEDRLEAAFIELSEALGEAGK